MRLDDELALGGKPEKASFDSAASRPLGVKNGNVLALPEEIVFGKGAPALEKLERVFPRDARCDAAPEEIGVVDACV